MDKIFSRILFATDLGPQSLYIGQQAVKLSSLCEAQLFALHVIEPPITYTSDFSGHDKSIEKSKTLATKSLTALCTQLEIPITQQLIQVGIPQSEILELCTKKRCDLIVVGSAGIGGYTHSLGSTAHKLLTEAPCNVFIVQVRSLEPQVAQHAEYFWEPPHQPSSTLRPQGPTQGGSISGFGEDIRRGPHLTNRPIGTPYKGGTRTRTSEEEENDPDK